jgi:hypothetical protein
MDKVTVELYDVVNLSGIIVPRNTGIVWENQAGGTACAHPKLEGVFVPLACFMPWGNEIPDPLLDHVGSRYISKLVDKFLDATDLRSWFRSLTTKEAHELLPHFDKSDCYLYEAWVPAYICTEDEVIAQRDPIRRGLPHVTPAFGGGWGVLVYNNSD